MEPAKFSVNFVKEGKYKISLRRWPVESGLALGAEVNDAVPPTPFMNGSIAGKAMRFSKAFVKIGEEEYTTGVNNADQSTTMEVEVEKGETELLAYFDMEDGTPCNAFYVYVSKVLAN